jgi:ABC-type Mn2+/Zn2+ transport system ATPase subunit
MFDRVRSEVVIYDHPMPDTSLPPAVAATDVTLAYGAHVALRRASFTLPRAATTAIIGPNGSGKTTLLRALSGLELPVSGDLRVLDDPARRQRRAIAHVMQSHAVNEAVPLTVLEAVRIGRYARRGLVRRLHRADHDAVEAAIDRMDIGDLIHRHLRELSGGQRQRVFVAQGLAQEADLLLLDEPITGLDMISEERIKDAMADEVAAGRTVIVTTHDVGAASAADHVLLLATHVVASGPPAEVLVEEHLTHAYGAAAYRTADGTVIIADPHVHGTAIRGHEDH